MKLPPSATACNFRSRVTLANTRGFTLIELMITVAIMAIFATLAAPSFRDLIATQRMRSATSALTESLWLARSEALKRNTVVGFSFDNISTGWNIKAGATTLHTQDAFPSISSGAGSFQFNAYGRLPDAMKIELGMATANLYRCVTVSTAGRVLEKEGKCT